MPLKIGVQAPDFTLPSTTGDSFTLSQDLTGKPVILYFYPKNFTTVCTEEACEFRDAFEDFRDLDIDVVGISKDSIASHQKFKKSHNLPFQLLSDAQGAVAKKYNATLPILRATKRVTYLLDEKHQIKAVLDNMFSAKKHLKAMLDAATRMEFPPEQLK